MKVVDGLHLAEDLVQHHLPSGEWAVVLIRSRALAGECVHSQKVIRITVDSILYYSRKQLIDVVLHEIAHALVGPGKGHGLEWSKKAIELGIDPSDTAPEMKKAPHPVNNWRSWMGMIAILIGVCQVHAGIGAALITLATLVGAVLIWQRFGPIEKVYNLS